MLLTCLLCGYQWNGRLVDYEKAVKANKPIICPGCHKDTRPKSEGGE